MRKEKGKWRTKKMVKDVDHRGDSTTRWKLLREVDQEDNPRKS